MRNFNLSRWKLVYAPMVQNSIAENENRNRYKMVLHKRKFALDVNIYYVDDDKP